MLPASTCHQSRSTPVFDSFRIQAFPSHSVQLSGSCWSPTNMSPALLKTADSTAMLYLGGVLPRETIAQEGIAFPAGSDIGILSIVDRSMVAISGSVASDDVPARRPL